MFHDVELLGLARNFFRVFSDVIGDHDVIACGVESGGLGGGLCPVLSSGVGVNYHVLSGVEVAASGGLGRGGAGGNL